MKKKALSQAIRKKISQAQLGKNNSMYGRTHSKEALRKIKEASRGKNNPMFGKTHTAEARKKISLAARARWKKAKAKSK